MVKEEPDKDIDQVFVEQPIEELPGLRGWEFIRCEREFYDDPNRRIIYLKNARNEDVTIRFLAAFQPEGLRESSRGSKRSGDHRKLARTNRTPKGCQPRFTEGTSHHNQLLPSPTVLSVRQRTSACRGVFPGSLCSFSRNSSQ